ncbi:MAG: sulfatase [Planctomycetota bacterium]|nr:sulfatase [Planctomycetota bacterium]
MQIHPSYQKLQPLLPLISAIWACALWQTAWAGQPAAPNLVLIISDDQAWTDFGFMGHDVVQTPRLDQLARQSVLFPRGYVPTSLCRPSLMTLATGLYAHQHLTTGNDPSPRLAPPSSVAYKELRSRLIDHIDRQPTLAQILGLRGYRSHQSGKWWEGGYRRGGFTHGMTRGFPKPGGRHGDDGLKIGRQGLQPVLDFMQSAVQQETPFFVWYAPFLPHSPHNPPERVLRRYRVPGRPAKLAKYYAMCEWFDETCGQLLDALEDLRVQDNTLVAFVTDNGWIQRTAGTQVPAGWRPQFAPRSKQSPYEGGVRTPIMLRWPGRIPAARRDELVSSIDLVPTLLAAAGGDVPAKLPGLNLLPLVMHNRPLKRDALLGEGFAHDIADLDVPEASLLYRWCIRDRWKLVLSYDGQVNRYRAVHGSRAVGPQLFDLLADPHEEHNLAKQHPQVVAELAARIDRWWPVRQRQTVVTP